MLVICSSIYFKIDGRQGFQYVVNKKHIFKILLFNGACYNWITKILLDNYT